MNLNEKISDKHISDAFVDDRYDPWIAFNRRQKITLNEVKPFMRGIYRFHTVAIVQHSIMLFISFP